MCRVTPTHHNCLHRFQKRFQCGILACLCRNTTERVPSYHRSSRLSVAVRYRRSVWLCEYKRTNVITIELTMYIMPIEFNSTMFRRSCRTAYILRYTSRLRSVKRLPSNELVYESVKVLHHFYRFIMSRGFLSVSEIAVLLVRRAAGE